jgi:hypothetical protein
MLSIHSWLKQHPYLDHLFMPHQHLTASCQTQLMEPSSIFQVLRVPSPRNASLLRLGGRRQMVSLLRQPRRFCAPRFLYSCSDPLARVPSSIKQECSPVQHKAGMFPRPGSVVNALTRCINLTTESSI